MNDHGFFTIWNNSLDESRKEFVNKFVELTSSENKEGLYTFIFSRYDDFKTITETLYSIVYKDTAFFLWSPDNLVLYLDTELGVIDSKSIDLNISIIDKIIETPNLEYLGFLVDGIGKGFHTFTLKEQYAYELGKELFDDHLINIENITISESDLIDLTLEHLDFVTEHFQEIVVKAIEKDEYDPRIVENPFANAYFDKDEIPQMTEEKRTLNENENSNVESSV
jgi:hypothetical protein